MRQIVLDTETTGLNPRSGDRIIEVGCVEIVNRQLTGRNFHRYINPERDSEEGALAVHGLTTEFLNDKPKFAEIVEELREFARGAEIIIHNAPFDLAFLDAEYGRLGLARFESEAANIVDTLKEAKQMFPGKRNSLDALCDRFGISNAHRALHGALLDAELLAEVYLAMTRGQNSLTMDLEDDNGSSESGEQDVIGVADIIVLAANADEIALHESVLDGLDKDAKGQCIWRSSPAPAET